MKRDGRVIGVAIDGRVAVDRNARGGFRGKRGIEALVGTEGIVRGELRGGVPDQGQEKERENEPGQGPREAGSRRGSFARSRWRGGVPDQGQERERKNEPGQGPREAGSRRGSFARSRWRRGIRSLRARRNSTLLFFHKTQDSAVSREDGTFLSGMGCARRDNGNPDILRATHPVYDESRMPAEALQSHQRPGRRAHVLIALLALALVLFPFLFWYHTWFGRKLSDAQLDAYFADRAKPRHIKNALVQLGERVSRGQNAARWYPLVIAEAASPNLEIRQTAAWIMGQDRGYPPFHAGLLKLIHDPEAMVRRNAALGLAAFADGAARGELVAMLRPFLVRAAVAGPLRYRLKLGDYVNPGTLLAHVGDGERAEE